MIVCLGTTPCRQRTMTFARIEIDSINRATAVHDFASGKSINVGRVLHTLGEPSVACGLIGGDAATFIRADLDRAGIRHDLVDVLPATRSCITLIDQFRKTATELIEEAHPLAATDYERLLAKLKALLRQASALVLSGSLPSGANSSFYAECIACAEPGLPVIVDARGEPLLATLDRRPSVVKLNRVELSQTLGALVDDEDAAFDAMRRLLALGASHVIVTAGKEPTLLADTTNRWRIVTPPVSAVNPIGSGDAFAAGLAAEMQRGKVVPVACVLGTACAAANAMTLHAGHVYREDVQRLCKSIRIEAI